MAMPTASPTRRNDRLAEARERAEAAYAGANPASARAINAAAAVLPGGNTRTTLHFSPFPLVVRRGEGARVEDLDGHVYTDYINDYSAGLFGHSSPVVRAAVDEAMAGGISYGLPSEREALLAAEVNRRFPAMERLRFCTSGTEANTLVIQTARSVTGRSAVMVFEGGYHGSTIQFRHGPLAMTLPLPWIMARYNDIPGTEALIARHAEDLACVLLEPLQGGGGCIPATPAFLGMLREAADRHGFVLAFDEVMTARLGPGGRQGRLGIRPDMVSLGKFVGGGFGFGAFGGRADIMDRFDPRRGDSLPHGGTFNNSALPMAAGYAALTRTLDAATQQGLNDLGDDLRGRLNAVARRHDLPLVVTGEGSLMCLHFQRAEPTGWHDTWSGDPALEAMRDDLRAILHLFLIGQGRLIARRGMLALSLDNTAADVAALAEDFGRFVAAHRTLFDPLDA